MRPSFASSHNAADFPEPEPAPAPRFEVDPAPERIMREEAAAPEPVPAGLHEAPSEAPSLDALRNAMVANFEQNDLDVPAFLRKRGEIM